MVEIATFMCEPYKVKLSKDSCSKRYVFANSPEAHSGDRTRMQMCIGCDVGKKHAAGRPVDVPVERLKVMASPRAEVKPKAQLPKPEPVKRTPVRYPEADARTIVVGGARHESKQHIETPPPVSQMGEAHVPMEAVELPPPGEFARSRQLTPRARAKIGQTTIKRNKAMADRYKFRDYPEPMTVREIAPYLGITEAALFWRIKKWGAERAFAVQGPIAGRPRIKPLPEPKLPPYEGPPLGRLATPLCTLDLPEEPEAAPPSGPSIAGTEVATPAIPPPAMLPSVEQGEVARPAALLRMFGYRVEAVRVPKGLALLVTNPEHDGSET